MCLYTLPLPGAYHTDELVNIWRARTLFFSLSLSSVRFPTNIIEAQYILHALTRLNRVWMQAHAREKHPIPTTQYSELYPFFMMAKLSGTNHC